MADFIRSRRANAGRTPWLNLVLAIGIPLLLGGIVTALLLNGGALQPPKQNGDVDKDGSILGPVVACLTDEDLDEQYKANEPAAKSKYGDKIVDVMGRVKQVREDEKVNRWFIDLDGVECQFMPNAKGGLLQLTTGHMVSVRGKCIGRQNGTVRLVECQLVPAPTGRPTNQFNSVDLLSQELIKNREGKELKLSGKIIDVTGEIGATNPNNIERWPHIGNRSRG